MTYGLLGSTFNNGFGKENGMNYIIYTITMYVGYIYFRDFYLRFNILCKQKTPVIQSSYQ